MERLFENGRPQFWRTYSVSAPRVKRRDEQCSTSAEGEDAVSNKSTLSAGKRSMQKPEQNIAF